MVGLLSAFKQAAANRWGIGDAVRLLPSMVVVGLCVCVIMQMLGAPTTMWNPECTVDGLHGVVIEGLSIPPTVTTVCRTSGRALASDRPLERPSPLLDRSLFHPPDLSHTREASGKVFIEA